ncbi:cysteine desulfurase family protein [Endothiovibrio diazotrophicus]
MPVYLDHNATTPLDERVMEAMRPFLGRTHGNPSSVHRYGRLVRGAVDRARERVAALVGAHPSQVLFTGGGTEANNLALKGVLRSGEGLAVSRVEHASVIAPAQALARHGHPLGWVEVDCEGRFDLASLEEALAARPRLVSLMLANNEVGTLQELAPLAERVIAAGAWLHTDAVQACGKIVVDFAAGGAHLMSMSAHKFGGPQGVGALVVDKRLEIEPLVHGGGQERGLRGGTENVAGLVGFGKAAELAKGELAERAVRMGRLRDRLEVGLAAIGGVTRFAAGAERLPNTVMFAAPGIDGETLLMSLDRLGVALSSGSACSSGSTEPSHVLTAMGVARETALGAVRASFGPNTEEAEVDQLLAALQQVLVSPR